MRRCVLAAVVALVGCAEQGSPRTNVPQAKQAGSSRPGSTGEPAGVTAALRTARERAELAIALVPPKYTDRGEKAEALAYMQGPLAQWIKRRRQLQEAALAEYERAQAHTPPALPYASEEVGKLQADFAEHFVTASISAMPPSIRDSAPMSVAFENAIREAAEPQLAAARAAFTRCASEARTAKLELLKARCDKRLAALPRVHADVSPESSPNLADAKARPWLKTRQPRACVYAGSLETYAPVFASIDDAQPVAHLAGAFAVEVDEFTPATSDGGRTRIDLSWPVRATWWLDASAKPLELARRVDIVPGHVWLEPGSPVTVARRAGTRVTVVRDLTEGGRRKVEPQSFQATLNCSELRLASYAKALWAHEGERMLLPTEGARLFDAPGGKPVARVEGGTFFPVFLRARRAGFARVVGNNGFVFDGWVESKDVTGKAQAILASAPPTLYSHVIDAQLPLRAEPRTSSPIVATLVPGALVTLHGHTGTFTELAVVGLGEVGRAHRFFVDTVEFNRAATAAALGPR